MNDYASLGPLVLPVPALVRRTHDRELRACELGELPVERCSMLRAGVVDGTMSRMASTGGGVVEEVDGEPKDPNAKAEDKNQREERT